MAYTTYEFYTTTYYGTTITTEPVFDKWLSKATDKLNYLTFGNITDETAVEFATQISKATCALMDLLFELDKAKNNATSTESGNIKSMSSGNESVTFGNNDTVITTVLADTKAQLTLMRETIAEYLNDTGLLYGGC